MSLYTLFNVGESEFKYCGTLVCLSLVVLYKFDLILLEHKGNLSALLRCLGDLEGL